MPIKVGDFVQVIGGPACTAGFGGRTIKGRVMELFAAKTMTGTEPAAIVKVASGGEWGFRVDDLRVLPKHAVPGLRG